MLDDLSSTRSSNAQRVCALQGIEQLLANLCGPKGLQSAFDAFIRLQNTFEHNVASRLATVLASWLLLLRENLETTKVSSPSESATEPAILQPIMQALSILQGVALLHQPSKAFLGRRWCIQLFLDFIAVSKHIPHSPDASDSGPCSQDGLFIPASNLATSVMDTLLCILVDTPKATRCFEEVGGLDVVVRTLKRPGVHRDVRMKCLEFLYFYLLPEDSDAVYPDSNDQFDETDGSSTPREPTWLAISTPPTTSPSLSSSLSSNASFKPDGTFAPNPKVAELKMLRRDIDFVPATPTKKEQVANLGIGSPLSARGLYTPSTTPSKRRGTTLSSSGSSLDSGMESPAEPRTPRREYHVRGRSDVTLVNVHEEDRRSSYSSRSSQEEIPRTPIKASKYSPVTPKLKTPSRLHTRGTSMASTLVGSPIVSRSDDARSTKKARSRSQLKGGGDDGNQIRSTEEKTAMLGNYLGNVAALVEGMKKAGAWGLE